MNIQQISQNTQLKELLGDSGVRHAMVFGSYAKDSQKNTSDIDLLVKFSDDSIDTYMKDEVLSSSALVYKQETPYKSLAL